MKQNIFPAIRLTLVMLILCVGIYSGIVWIIAQAAPNHGQGALVQDKSGKSYYANIGQKFEGNYYFNSRPSAVDYNAAGSGGSNKGPNNPDFLKDVQARVDAFKAANPGPPVPVDMVTASGSGLDPDISVAAAKSQAARIAKVRNINIASVEQLINQHIEQGIAGPAKINVLKLNIDLDKLK